MSAEIKVKKQHIHTIGRRKTSTARVFLQKGKGKIQVNDQPIETFFRAGNRWLEMAIQPIKCVNAEGQFDAYITVGGGGITGQAGAIRLGLARALDLFDQKLTTKATVSEEGEGENSQPDTSWHSMLKQDGLLTRDPRSVLRKVYGRKKARKREQYSKR